MLDFGRALAAAAPTFTFPHAKNLQSSAVQPQESKPAPE
jgi:hypothetical protein